MTRRFLYILAGIAAALLIAWTVLAGLGAHHAAQGTQAEQQAHQQHQEAQTHAQAAQAIPDHTAAIQAAETRAKASEAKAVKLRRERDELLARLAAQPPGPPDLRDEVIAKDKEVIGALVVENTDLKAQVGTLKLALADRTTQYEEMTKAYQHEQAARLAQEAATNAWKSAVKESRWRGRIEGFAMGVGLGYAGGKL